LGLIRLGKQCFDRSVNMDGGHGGLVPIKLPQAEGELFNYLGKWDIRDWN